MAVVLRLQGLNIEAGPEDIRRFFHGLPIPEGGVHITGGRLGEAFIIFSSKRAGQLAMLRSGKQLHGSTVSLHKSSMDEFMRVMQLRLRKHKPAPTVSEPVPQTRSATEHCTALPLMADEQGLEADVRTNQVQSPPVTSPRGTNVLKSGTIKRRPVSRSPEADRSPPVNNQVRVTEPTRHHVEEQQGGDRELSSCKPGYLRLYGLPASITKEEVCWFLNGLKVMDVNTDTLHGPDRCCLVKLASFKEAEEGLKYSFESPIDFQVEVRLAHERMWENALERRENSPRRTFSEQDRFSPDKHLHRYSPVKRPCSLRGSPKRRGSSSPSFDPEYCVMVKNLPKTITKTRIRDLFSCPDIPNCKILHLLNNLGERTSTAFIIFTKPEQYTFAMNMNGSVVCSQEIDVSSITKEKMKALIQQSRFADSERSRCCIYARNFPAGVRKAEVKDFFSACNVREKDIELLEDKSGNRIGEAIIQFGCEERAKEAHSLHGERFRQEQILLTCISLQQMKDILHENK